MPRPRRVDPKLVAQAQAVLLPAVAHTTLEETATLLGVSRASVPRLQ